MFSCTFRMSCSFFSVSLRQTIIALILQFCHFYLFWNSEETLVFCSVGLVLKAGEMSRVLTPTAAQGFKGCEGTCFTSLECSEMSKVQAVIDWYFSLKMCAFFFCWKCFGSIDTMEHKRYLHLAIQEHVCIECLNVHMFTACTVAPPSILPLYLLFDSLTQKGRGLTTGRDGRTGLGWGVCVLGES